MNAPTSYTYAVNWSEPDGEYVGLVVEMPSLSWLDTTEDAALAGIKVLVAQVTDDMRQAGEILPRSSHA